MFCQKWGTATTVPGNPDFCSLTEAFGIKSLKVNSKNEVDNGIKELLNSRDAMLLQVEIE